MFASIWGSSQTPCPSHIVWILGDAERQAPVSVGILDLRFGVQAFGMKV